MKTQFMGKRYLKIARQWCLAVDVGCADFAQAAWSREHQHDTDAWWKAMEAIRWSMPNQWVGAKLIQQRVGT